MATTKSTYRRDRAGKMQTSHLMLCVVLLTVASCGEVSDARDADAEQSMDAAIDPSSDGSSVDGSNIAGDPALQRDAAVDDGASGGMDGDVVSDTGVPDADAEVDGASPDEDTPEGTGELMWATRAGGATGSGGKSLAALPDGSTVVVGSFMGTVILGAGESRATALSSAGNADLLLARYDANGSLVWARRDGGRGAEAGLDVAVLADGSTLVTGAFTGKAIFGDGQPSQITLSSPGDEDHDAFIARYDADGVLAWARRVGSVGPDGGAAIAAFADGSSVVAGSYTGPIAFQTGVDTETVLAGRDGGTDYFLARYNADGTVAWATRTSAGHDHPLNMAAGIAAAVDGSVLLTGSFAETAIFGLGELAETALVSAGSDDVFLARYDAGGTLAWVKRAGGTGVDTPAALAALADGSALITGEFTGTATFGAGEVHETVITGGSHGDTFVARFNPDGTVVWAKSAGDGPSQDQAQGISVLPDGSAFVTGFFRTSATFGSGEANQTQLTSNGYQSVFVARYQPDGTLGWARTVETFEPNEGRDVVALADGSAVVTGFFSGQVTFGAGESNETLLSTPERFSPQESLFVARYDADGTVAWARGIGGNGGDDGGSSIATLADGSSLVTGSFSGTAVFGRGEARETVLASNGAGDLFVAKYAADGTLVWAKRAGGTGRDSGNGIDALADGSFLVAGGTSNSAVFGAGEPNQTMLPGGQNGDVEFDYPFIARYHDDGTLVWVKQIDGGHFTDVAALPTGASIVVGTAFGRITLGAGEASETVLSSELGEDYVFVAKYEADGRLAHATKVIAVRGAPRIAAFPDGASFIAGPVTSWLTPDGALTGTFSGSGADVAALADGSVVVAGSFSGSATFGLGQPNETVLTTAWPNSTFNDVFVARYDRDGALVWARSAGGIGQDIATNVAALGDGTVLVAGSFTADATFGPGEPRETVLPAQGRGLFVARFDGRTGALVWARAMDLQYYTDSVRGLAGGMDGSAFVTGSFYGSGTFGPGEASQTTLLSAGGFDVFVARLSP